MLATGLDGIDNQIDCPTALNNVNVYHLTTEERAERKIASLPGSLAEAVRELEKDEVIKAALCADIYASFERATCAEIDGHRTRVTHWEIERYL